MKTLSKNLKDIIVIGVIVFFTALYIATILWVVFSDKQFLAQ